MNEHSTEQQPTEQPPVKRRRIPGGRWTITGATVVVIGIGITLISRMYIANVDVNASIMADNAGEYTQALQDVTTAQHLVVTSLGQNQLVAAQRLAASHMAYLAGAQAYKQQRYNLALSDLKRVIPGDKSYHQAQGLITAMANNQTLLSFLHDIKAWEVKENNITTDINTTANLINALPNDQFGTAAYAQGMASAGVDINSTFVNDVHALQGAATPLVTAGQTILNKSNKNNAVVNGLINQVTAIQTDAALLDQIAQDDLGNIQQQAQNYDPNYYATSSPYPTLPTTSWDATINDVQTRVNTIATDVARLKASELPAGKDLSGFYAGIAG